jgi:hypothetical protein|tara:strand:+ start:39 stop:746 length:708 start_codon:yes stop_codon:yes gene_type:complete
MKEITQIRKLSLWIFFIPLIAINFCLFISINFHFFENTIFVVDQIGRSNFSIPYIDGSLSISRASRTYPAFLIFKPSMIATSILLYFYWSKNNLLVNNFNNISNKNYNFKTFGILSAIFLAIHSILLGVEFDIKIFKLLRRVVLLSFIIFEIVAQALLVYNFYILKNKIGIYFKTAILKIKIILVSVLIVVAILSLPILTNSGNVHFKHALEWNYFIGVIFFYFLTRFLWKNSIR